MITLRPEREQLFAESLSSARGGTPRLLCIEGDPGVGKTTHLRELVDMASGFRVLTVTGVEAPYRPPLRNP